MPDDAAFLRLICADPDADGPRLVYADYLDEKGDAARAEFIRVQCALAAAGPADPAFADLVLRERALLSAHWPEWLRPACQALAERSPVTSDRYSLTWLDEVGSPAAPGHLIEQREGTELPYFHSGQFRRGFLAHVALIAKAYRSAGYVARLFEKAPLDGLTLAQFPEKEVAATLAAIDAPRLRHLELIGIPSEAVRAVAGSAALANVREMVVIGGRGYADVGMLLGGPDVLPGLRSLILHGCSIGYYGLEHLARAPFVGRLEFLELVSCGLTNAAAEVLMDLFPPGSALRELSLGIESMTGDGLRRLTDHFGAVVNLHATGRPWPVRYYQ